MLIASRTNRIVMWSAAGQIVMHKDVPVAALRQKLLTGHIRSFRKMLIAGRTNRIVMGRLSPSCSNAPVSHNLLFGQIRSYCKTPIVRRTNRFVLAERRAMCFTAPLCYHCILSEQLF